MIRRVILLGLVLQATVGFIGIPFGQPITSTLFAVGATGLLVAAVLLALQSFRAGYQLSAIGLALLAGHALLRLPGYALEIQGFDEHRAAIGVGAWTAAFIGFLLIGIGNRFALWVRIVGVLAGIGFVITALTVMLGFDAYTLQALITTSLMATVVMIGFIIDVWKDKEMVNFEPEMHHSEEDLGLSSNP